MKAWGLIGNGIHTDYVFECETRLAALTYFRIMVNLKPHSTFEVEEYHEKDEDTIRVMT